MSGLLTLQAMVQLGSHKSHTITCWKQQQVSALTIDRMLMAVEASITSLFVRFPSCTDIVCLGDLKIQNHGIK